MTAAHFPWVGLLPTQTSNFFPVYRKSNFPDKMSVGRLFVRCEVFFEIFLKLRDGQKGMYFFSSTLCRICRQMMATQDKTEFRVGAKWFPDTDSGSKSAISRWIPECCWYVIRFEITALPARSLFRYLQLGQTRAPNEYSTKAPPRSDPGRRAWHVGNCHRDRARGNEELWPGHWRWSARFTQFNEHWLFGGELRKSKKRTEDEVNPEHERSIADNNVDKEDKSSQN